MLKAIHVQEDRKAAQAKATEIVTRLAKAAAELVEQGAAETLTYYAYSRLTGGRSEGGESGVTS
jgi:hypothetical protein